MAFLDLVATSADLFIGVGESERKFPLLTYRVRLGRRELVELPTGENLGDLDGRVTLVTEIESAPGDDKAVGVMHYSERFDSDFDSFAARYLVQVRVSESQLRDLISSARAGRIPSNIGVEVEGMEYGHLPDGSDKKWDTKSSPRLKVSSLQLTLPLAGPAADDDMEADPRTDATPPTKAQLNLLAEKMDLLTAVTQRGLRGLTWALVIIGFVGVYLYRNHI